MANRRSRLIRLESVSGITGAPAGYPVDSTPDDVIPLETASPAVQDRFGTGAPGDWLYSPSSNNIYESPALWARQRGLQWPLPSSGSTASSTTTQTGASATPNDPGSGGSGGNGGTGQPTTGQNQTGAGNQTPTGLGGGGANLPVLSDGGNPGSQTAVLIGGHQINSGWLWLGLALLLLLLLNDDKKKHHDED